MKIAFCGDSFCANAGPNGLDDLWWWDPPDYDWPWLVAKHFKARIICHGISGVNFFRSFQKFLGRIDDADYIIFCVTEPYRVINKHNIPMTQKWLDEVSSQTELGTHFLNCAATEGIPSHPGREEHGLNREQILELAISGKYYYDNIMDHGAIEIMQQGFLMYVDNMMVKRNKKCIWLNSFSSSNNNRLGWTDAYVPQSGPMGNISLRSISEMTKHEPIPINLPNQGTDKEWADTYKDYATESLDIQLDKRRNHFTKNQNIRMSEMIIDAIKYDSFDSGILHMEDWFTLDEKEVENSDDPFIYP
jgi:hypothetical protein